MTRHIVGIAIAALVAVSIVANAGAAETKPTKKGHVSTTPIVFTKHYDKASPTLS